MSSAESLFHEIAANIPQTTEGKMFGALCIKALNGKPGVMFWKDALVFKLPGDALQQALELEGAHIFEPSPGKKMGGWVQLSLQHQARWKELAHQSMELVGSL